MQLSNFGVEYSKIRYYNTTLTHCIMLSGRSKSGYEFSRNTGFLTLPSQVTMKSYTGTSNGKVEVNELIRKRLDMERAGLEYFHETLVSPQHRLNARDDGKLYLNWRQQYVGQVDYGGVPGTRGNRPEDQDKEKEGELANSVVSFLINGLNRKFDVLVRT